MRQDAVGSRGMLQLVWRACEAGGIAAMGLVCAELLSGCVVAGYSSGSGFFLWPGSLGLVVVVLLVVFLLRRAR